MASSIKTVLDLDISKFKSNAAEAVSVAGRTIGGGLGKALGKKVGLDDAFKGFVAGIGISVESIAEKLTSGFKAAADQAEKIAELTKETAEIYGRIFSGRRTDEQNLAVNLRQQSRLQRDLELTKEKTVETKQFNPFTQQFETQQRKIAGDPERAVEIAKELATLAQEEQDLKKKISETQKKSSDDYAGKLKELNELTEKNAREQLDADAKINALVEKQRNLRGEAMASGNIDRLIEAEKLEAEILTLKEAQTEEQKKQAKEAFKLLDEADKLRRNMGEAYQGVLKAQDKVQEANHDRLAFTVDEAAGGKRGSGSDRAKAREIQRLEKQAKRIYDRNDLDLMNLSGTGPLSAEDVQRKADKLRSQFDRLNTQEKNPNASLEAALKDAAQKFEEAAEKFATIEIDLEDQA